jgi:addiction module HigA family antidote
MSEQAVERITPEPITPGEVLLEEFMSPLGLSQNRLAQAIKVPPRRVNEIVLGKRRITADTALRLGRFFGTTAEFWVNLQAYYDLETAKAKAEAVILREIEPLGRPAPAGTA